MFKILGKKALWNSVPREVFSLYYLPSVAGIVAGTGRVVLSFTGSQARESWVADLEAAIQRYYQSRALKTKKRKIEHSVLAGICIYWFLPALSFPPW